MFNIGSFEVLLICVIALLVLGPERLPTAVRTAGLWIGRFRRSFYKVKTEIERELNADEIRRQLHNESVMAEIEEAKTEVEGVAKEAEQSVNKIVNSANFDPGAPQYTDEQLDASNAESEAVQEKSVKQEINEAGGEVDKEAGKEIGKEAGEIAGKETGEQIADAKQEVRREVRREVKQEVKRKAKQPLYGTGKNPKLEAGQSDENKAE